MHSSVKEPGISTELSKAYNCRKYNSRPNYRVVICVSNILPTGDTNIITSKLVFMIFYSLNCDKQLLSKLKNALEHLNLMNSLVHSTRLFDMCPWRLFWVFCAPFNYSINCLSDFDFRVERIVTLWVPRYTFKTNTKEL